MANRRYSTSVQGKQPRWFVSLSRGTMANFGRFSGGQKEQPNAKKRWGGTSNGTQTSMRPYAAGSIPARPHTSPTLSTKMPLAGLLSPNGWAASSSGGRQKMHIMMVEHSKNTIKPLTWPTNGRQAGLGIQPPQVHLLKVKSKGVCLGCQPPAMTSAVGGRPRPIQSTGSLC
jgi:hypothetical protein